MIGFTRSLATEFGEQGVNVNAIAPGLTRTPGTLAGKEVPGEISNEGLFEMMANMQSIKRRERCPIWSERCRFSPARTRASSPGRRFTSTAG